MIHHARVVAQKEIVCTAYICVESLNALLSVEAFLNELQFTCCLLEIRRYLQLRLQASHFVVERVGMVELAVVYYVEPASRRANSIHILPSVLLGEQMAETIFQFNFLLSKSARAAEKASVEVQHFTSICFVVEHLDRFEVRAQVRIT